MKTRTAIFAANLGLVAAFSAAPVPAASASPADKADQPVKTANSVSPGLTPFGEGVSSLTGTSEKAAEVSADSGHSLSISLQGVAPRASASEQGVYTFSSGSGYSAVVDNTKSSSRVRYVIDSKTGSKDISFKVSGGTPHLEADGSVEIPLGNGERGVIKKPWAVDAKGQAIQTNYSVEGNTVTQHVKFSPNSSFPVVADPTFGIEHYFAPTMYLNKSETNKAQNATYVSWLCGQWGGAPGVLCAGNLASIALNAKRAVSHHKCARLLFSPGVIDTEEYTGGNCK